MSEHSLLEQAEVLLRETRRQLEGTERQLENAERERDLAESRLEEYYQAWRFNPYAD